MLSLISNISCFPVFLLCPITNKFFKAVGMHLMGRMWGAGEICPGCKAVTGPDFWWFSRPYGLPCRDKRPPFKLRSFAASGIFVQGGFAVFMIWGQVLAGVVWGGVETHSFLNCCSQPVDVLFLLLYRAWAWKCLLTEIKDDLETLRQAHHFSEYDSAIIVIKALRKLWQLYFSLTPTSHWTAILVLQQYKKCH